jgi:hypothetical protein
MRLPPGAIAHDRIELTLTLTDTASGDVLTRKAVFRGPER